MPIHYETIMPGKKYHFDANPKVWNSTNQVIINVPKPTIERIKRENEGKIPDIFLVTLETHNPESYNIGNEESEIYPDGELTNEILCDDGGEKADS